MAMRGVVVMSAFSLVVVAAAVVAQPEPSTLSTPSTPSALPSAGHTAVQVPTKGVLKVPSTSPAPAVEGAIQVDGSAVVWTPATNLPEGTLWSVLEGDPTKTGLFTIRLKLPPLFHLGPHTHPVNERVTILEGDVAVGFGTRDDPRAARRFGPGDFYVNPPTIPHAVWSRGGAVIQITGEGPWTVTSVTSASPGLAPIPVTG